MAQYLDLTGLNLLWAKIKNADAAVKEELLSVVEGLSIVDDVKYVDGKVVLYKNGEQVGEGFDASAFIADGMLDDVEVVEASAESPINGAESGKFIKFTWNVKDESGEYKVDYLSVAELQADLSGIESRLDEAEAKIADAETKLTSHDDLLAALQSDLDAVEADVETVKSDLKTAQADIAALKEATGTGEVEYKDITFDSDADKFVGDYTEAPKTSSVVAALNDLRDELKGDLDLSAYYTSEQVDGLLATKEDVMEAIPDSEIEALS